MKRLLIAILALTAGCSKPQPAGEDRSDQSVIPDTTMSIDKTTLSTEDKNLLSAFRERRKSFDQQLIQANRQHEFVTCLSCGFPTIAVRGDYEICIICDWEDDKKDEFSNVPGGANNISLLQSQLKINRELTLLADSLQGKIVSDLDQFFTIFYQHDKRMSAFSDDKMMHAHRDDRIWKEWSKVRESIKPDLIVK